MLCYLIGAALAVSLVVPASAQDIGGQYTAAGTNLDGSEYSGTATITLTSDTTCVIEWKTGATNAQGICSRNENAFAAAYVQGDLVGLTIYQVKEDGSLEGLWTIAGQEGNGTETLTPAN